MSSVVDALKTWAQEPRPWPEEILLDRFQEAHRLDGKSTAEPKVERPIKRARSAKKKPRAQALGIPVAAGAASSFSLAAVAEKEKEEEENEDRSMLTAAELRKLVTGIVRRNVDIGRSSDPVGTQTVIENTLRIVQASLDTAKRRGDTLQKEDLNKIATKACITNAEMLGMVLMYRARGNSSAAFSSRTHHHLGLSSSVSSVPGDPEERLRQRQMAMAETPLSAAGSSIKKEPPALPRNLPLPSPSLVPPSDPEMYVTPLIKQSRSH